jgi:DNA-binding XRE family transcriptional regulator
MLARVYGPFCGPWSASALGRHAQSLTPPFDDWVSAFRQLRTAHNWTQEDFGGECGLDRSYVSGLEVGRRNPTYLNLLKITTRLDVRKAAV